MQLKNLFILLVQTITALAQMPDRIIFPDIDDYEIECTLSDGEQGMCRNIRYCPSAYDSRERLKTCYFERSEQFVCCRDVPKEYAAKRACSSYYPSVHSIIGGLATQRNEFPYMVIIIIVVYSLIRKGGILALEFFIPFPIQKISLKNSRINYFRSNFKPACIGENVLLDNENVTAVGYGHTIFGGRSSDELLKAYLIVVGNEVCQTHYRDTNLLPLGLMDIQLCAQDRQFGHDTCQGDSGGPLILKIRHVPYVIGVTSFGLGCATEAPGVYTRASKYLDWIEAHVWPK
ncbi:PREDICTED: chymotrypsin-2-like [Rhagoletis zephyria]|uniref:chymotrypsin-2-like n=1 Tax=Rhagoletis zephyria TaxID=28612 RepID=UPI0008117B39|nr:PREDICTED: chymotrypsin-2-like [Rhagoletis zephyria]